MPKPKIVNGKKEKQQSGLIIAMNLHETLKKYLARASLIFIGADSCRTNTGLKNIYTLAGAGDQGGPGPP